MSRKKFIIHRPKNYTAFTNLYLKNLICNQVITKVKISNSLFNNQISHLYLNSPIFFFCLEVENTKKIYEDNITFLIDNSTRQNNQNTVCCLICIFD